MAMIMQEENSSKQQIRESVESCKKGWTNNVFCVERNKKIIYHLPAYLRLKVKNIVSMDLFTLTGQINCTFILSISYANMESHVVKFLSQNIELAFHKTDAIILDQKNLEVARKDDQSQKLLTLTLRKVIATKLSGDIFWSPFQKVKFIISLTMRSIKATIDEKNYIFKFNLMNCDDIDTKFSLAEEDSFGVFRIADKQLQAYYTNQFSFQNKKIQKQTSKIGSQTSSILTQPQVSKTKLGIDDEIEPLASKTNVKNFQYAHFILTAYKKPNPAILTIFFPLLLLGVINIAIFYQDNRLTGKTMVNIAALIVSFIALIPTVRQNTPVSPTVTITQILVFIESSTTLLTLGHMIQYRNATQYSADVNDGYVIACIVITSCVAFFIFAMILLHKFYWKRQYHKSRKSSNKKVNVKFDHKTWYNDLCDKYYFNEAEGFSTLNFETQPSNIKRIISKQTQGY